MMIVARCITGPPRAANNAARNLFTSSQENLPAAGRELSPKVKEIEPSGFQQNVRFENL